MNVYDFDKTIYAGDSSIDFTLFCYKRYPNLLKYIIYQVKGVFLYTIKKIEKTEMKECYSQQNITENYHSCLSTI